MERPMEMQHYNEVNKFANHAHEALMGVWWSGLMLKRTARAFFRAHTISDTQFNALVVLKVAGRPSPSENSANGSSLTSPTSPASSTAWRRRGSSRAAP